MPAKKTAETVTVETEKKARTPRQEPRKAFKRNTKVNVMWGLAELIPTAIADGGETGWKWAASCVDHAQYVITKTEHDAWEQTRDTTGFCTDCAEAAKPKSEAKKPRTRSTKKVVEVDGVKVAETEHVDA